MSLPVGSATDKVWATVYCKHPNVFWRSTSISRAVLAGWPNKTKDFLTILIMYSLIWDKESSKRLGQNEHSGWSKNDVINNITLSNNLCFRMSNGTTFNDFYGLVLAICCHHLLATGPLIFGSLFREAKRYCRILHWPRFLGMFYH